MTRHSKWIAGALTVAAVIATGAVIKSRTAHAQATYIKSPDHWVAYTIERELVSSINGGVSNVTEYRASDGSVMMIQHQVHGTGDRVSITNRRTGTYYRFQNGMWVAHPANPAPPPLTMLNADAVTPVASNDPRIGAAASLGFPVYEHRNANTGTINLLCPALNMLAVWSHSAKAGLEEHVTKITMGEPSVDFVPPQGAQVQQSSVPEGPGSVKELPSVTARRLQQQGHSPPYSTEHPGTGRRFREQSPKRDHVRVTARVTFRREVRAA